MRAGIRTVEGGNRFSVQLHQQLEWMYVNGGAIEGLFAGNLQASFLIHAASGIHKTARMTAVHTSCSCKSIMLPRESNTRPNDLFVVRLRTLPQSAYSPPTAL